MLEEPVVPGTWVLIHMGFAVEIVDEAGAESAMAGLEMMARPRIDAEEELA
jgi:hydrogenase expression/formation protein HypC